MLPKDIHKKLCAVFPQASIDIKDMYGDGQHLKVQVGSDLFKGKNLLTQHRMVYAALEGIVGKKIHAISVHTREEK